MQFDVLIPARRDSTRLPGKPLLDVCGKALIQWTYEAARASAAERVVVVTDDERIAHAVENIGGEACITSHDHASGSDRLAEAVQLLGLLPNRIVVNLQGDEPLMPAAVINQVAAALVNDRGAVVATACHPITSAAEFRDPNVVKVVTDLHQRALYFSRAPIPAARRAGTSVEARRHIGIYAYRVDYLRRYTERPQTALEHRESLEQLRVLEHGDAITVCEADTPTGPGVDTVEDLETLREYVRDLG